MSTAAQQPVLLTNNKESVDQEFSFIEALSLPPKDSFTLVSREELDLLTTPVSAVAPRTQRPVPVSSPPRQFNLYPEIATPAAPATPATPARQAHNNHTKTQHAEPLPTPASSKHSEAMSTPLKQQAQCIEIALKATGLGDRVSVRLLEYLATVKHLPDGFNELAHDFLDTCLILFSLEAGLREGIRNGNPLPVDIISELEKKFRVTQADFQAIETMVNRFLEYERKGTMGRWKRGWSKIFGANDVDKMTAHLGRTRESLKMSALMFQWTLGAEKIESEMGIGYTGLAAALDRMDHRSSTATSRRGGGELEVTKALSSSASHHRAHDEMSHVSTQPPLPPIPWAEQSTSFTQEIPSHSLTSERPYVPSESRQYSANGRQTASSTTSSQDRHHSGGLAAFDRMGSFDEHHEHEATSSTTSHEPDGFLEELDGVDLETSKAVRVKADPFVMPRWTPRNTSGADTVNLKSALLSAIRGKNHKIIEQLLDQGVPPNTGRELHALNQAVLGRDAESVRLLLLFGADPNSTDRDGMTPLFLAIERSFLFGATQLLKYGADPNLSAGPDQETPLGLSAIANRLSLTQLLFIYGGEANHMLYNGNTLLIGAINKKTPKKFIDMILEYGADPNGKSREGKTALFEAIQDGRPDIVTSLLDKGANPNLPGPKHMLWPSTYQSECLRILLAHGADAKKAPGVMELATSINNIDSVRILLKAGVDPNAKKDGVYTPLCTSIRDNRPDIFHLLLSNGADPNTPASEYPAFKCITHNRLHFLPHLAKAGASLTSPNGIVETAVASNNMEALNWLLDQGLGPNEKNPKGHSPLTTAIREGRIEMVDLLLSRGADPNMRGQDWPVCMAVRSPPMLKRILAVLAEPRAFKGVMEMAVVANQLESVKLLLAAGVSVEDKNGGVFSPLTTGIREDRREIVDFLIEDGGADVNSPGEHLPIVKALRRFTGEDTHFVELLLDRGADPNKVYRGWNGIMQAVENGDESVLRLLSERAGVDMDIKDELGRTVTEIAASRGWDEGVKILQDGVLRN